jgi:hypothetical protein
MLEKADDVCVYTYAVIYVHAYYQIVWSLTRSNTMLYVCTYTMIYVCRYTMMYVCTYIVWYVFKYTLIYVCMYTVTNVPMYKIRLFHGN